MDEIQTNVLRIFLLAIHSHLYSFALRFLFLQTHATSYSFYSQLVYTVKENGGKADREPHPLPPSLRNPYRNLKSENSQDYAQKPQRNCTFMNLASRQTGPEMVEIRCPFTHFRDMATRRIFWGFCINRFGIGPLHFEFAEIVVIKKRLPDSATRQQLPSKKENPR